MDHENRTCPWERISDFDGWVEFERFETWLRNQTIDGDVAEIPVLKSYNEICNFQEKWFIYKPSGQIWRLVWPEPPFAGLFEKVT
jgi:hypothetical protein